MDKVFIFLFGLLFGIALTWLFELTLQTNKKWRKRYYKNHAIIWGYHIHHSSYGVLSLLVSIIFSLIPEMPIALFIASFGLGIIIMHTISDPRHRIVFIERDKKI